MIEHILIIAAIGTILSLDVTLAGQMLLSRPIVVLTLIGFYLHDPVSGFALGVILELACVDMLPLGVAIPLDTAVMSSIAGGVFFLNNFRTGTQSMTLSLLIAFLTGLVFSHYDLWFKKKTAVMFTCMQARNISPDKLITGAIIYNIPLTMLRNFVFLIVFLSISSYIKKLFFTMFPLWVIDGFLVFDGFLPVFAISIAVMAFRTRRMNA